jgi:hypothetical protein
VSALTQFAAVFCLRARVQAAYRLSACANAVCVLVGVLLLVLIAAAPPPTFLTHCAPGFWADNATNGICDRDAYIAYVAGARVDARGTEWSPAADFSATQDATSHARADVVSRSARRAGDNTDVATSAALGVNVPYANPLYREYCVTPGIFPPFCDVAGTVIAPDLSGLSTVYSNKRGDANPLYGSPGSFGVTIGFSDYSASGGASFASLDLLGTSNSVLPPPLPLRTSRVAVDAPGGDAIANALYAAASAAAAAATPLNGTCANGSAYCVTSPRLLRWAVFAASCLPVSPNFLAPFLPQTLASTFPRAAWLASWCLTPRRTRRAAQCRASPWR